MTVKRLGVHRRALQQCEHVPLLSVEHSDVRLHCTNRRVETLLPVVCLATDNVVTTPLSSLVLLKCDAERGIALFDALLWPSRINFQYQVEADDLMRMMVSK